MTARTTWQPEIRWSPAELQVDIERALTVVRNDRLTEPVELYLEIFEEVQGHMETLLEITNDLARLDEHAPVRRIERISDLARTAAPLPA